MCELLALQWLSLYAETSWFCYDGGPGDLAGWVAQTGEAGAELADDAGIEPRNVDSYAEEIGVGSTLADFAAWARETSRHSFEPEVRAAAVRAYIRAGYE